MTRLYVRTPSSAVKIDVALRPPSLEGMVFILGIQVFGILYPLMGVMSACCCRDRAQPTIGLARTTGARSGASLGSSGSSGAKTSQGLRAAATVPCLRFGTAESPAQALARPRIRRRRRHRRRSATGRWDRPARPSSAPTSRGVGGAKLASTPTNQRSKRRAAGGSRRKHFAAPLPPATASAYIT